MTTMRGTSHQATRCAELRIQVTINPAATAAATVQSSPIMKWYQKRPKAIGHERIRFTSGRRYEPERAPPLESDVGCTSERIERQQAEDRAVTGGPVDAETFN